jgi:hypothetical protein
MRRRCHREPCERPKRSEGCGRRENLQRSGREEAGLPAGEIFWPAGLAAAPAGFRFSETCRGLGLVETDDTETCVVHPNEHHATVDGGSNG